MHEPREDPIDEEAPAPDRWEQERDVLDDPDDAEESLTPRLPDPGAVDADVADVVEQSIEVPDEERRDEAE
ncbi:hypothetical protein OED01_10085 [Microbacterium sp. M28]|uniref:hypothetical protein n=1 Tax=Microbacterium sp. M28 TaxID=2962064 RepID=UPI0021F4187C|nr:hypothetical protein [Microbacterium sp. M28]UYO95957.1 hypothetical protein OED01_10085 [Microbacterium sp. M28]